MIALLLTILFLAALTAVSLGVYFLPFLVAAAREHDNTVAIFIVDLFLGWTLLGWVAALAWAFSNPRKIAVLFLLLASPAIAQERLYYVPLEQPCRLMDTRLQEAGPLQAGVTRAVDVVDSCGIPYGIKAIAANLTAVNAAGPGFLSTLRPTGQIPKNPSAPATSILNYVAGQTVANSALITLGEVHGHSWDGSFWLFAGVSGTDVIVDVTGYYVQ